MTNRLMSCIVRFAYRNLRSLLPIACCLLFTPLSIFAKNTDNCVHYGRLKSPTIDTIGAPDSLQTIDLQQVTITATMANERTPMTFTNLNREKIRKNDFGQDIPFLLQSTPSVVETSDAGAGVGYTGLRVRGSDATRTNVTVDGIPLNDSESQAVYWVNMPDFANSTSMIQIQRGVGTSTNGAGAFGSTINLVTSPLRSEKFIHYSGSIGSFNTQKHAISFGSGLLGKYISVDGRISRITSDGYVDRAASKLGSGYLSATYLNHNTSLRFKIFTGNERTYQSWYGIPFSYVNDSKLRTYNPAGTEKADTPYPSQVDDYQQTHSHLTLNHPFNPSLKLNASLHYTRGKGFYEEYKSEQKVKNYFLQDSVKVGEKYVKKTDLTRRLWLDNHFYGGIFSLTFKRKENEFIVGGGVNRYDGKHYGQVLWADKIPLENNQPKTFYESNATKTDANIYAKMNYKMGSKTDAFVDIQARSVGHKTSGFDRKQRDVSRDLSWFFFNPKVGLVHNYTEGGQFYGSFAVGNREPNRNDILDAVNNQTPQSEQLFNTELGWKLNRKKVSVGANFYHMYYKNQLVVTGQINDVGEQLRVNVPTSYRAGLEMEFAWRITEGLRFDYNATLSQNKIADFTEYRDNWDTGEQDVIKHGTTDITFSPNIIANASLTYQIWSSATSRTLAGLRGPKHQLEVALSGKHVGKQYVDNTSNENAILDDYKYGSFRVQYKTDFGKMKNFTLKLLINNILDSQFSSNAWVYRFNSPSYDERPDNPYTRLENGSVYNQMGYFPQAGRNFLLGFSVEF